MVTRGEPHDFFVRLDDTMKQVTTLLIFCIVESFLLLEAADKKPQLELTLFFTGYVQGNFEPCGCKSGPYGGLARRVDYISDYQKSSGGSSIQADAGNYFQLIGPYSDVVNRLMLDSLEVFPVQVLNLGTQRHPLPEPRLSQQTWFEAMPACLHPNLMRWFRFQLTRASWALP